jgi:glycosyltransferase involved in cell wall biosynthesis
MQPTKPLVSVLMAAYNVERYVASAIQSILNQDFRNLELIFIDDASSDRTLLIAKSIAETDSRIKIFCNDKNEGIVRSLNKGLSCCSADLVARADADDLATPNRIGIQYQYMEQHPDVGVIGAKVNFIDKHDKPIERQIHFFPSTFDEIKVHSLLGCQLWHTTVMFRKSLILENGGYSEALKGGPEDYELWSRLFKYTTFFNIPSTLASQRIHSQSITAQWSNGFQMFCDVAQNLQMEYLGRSVNADEARSIVALCGCEGNLSDVNLSKALIYIDEVIDTVKSRETERVYYAFLLKCETALKNQAKNSIYASPGTSRLLCFYVIRKNPNLRNLATLFFLSIKSLMPEPMRRFLSFSQNFFAKR